MRKKGENTMGYAFISYSTKNQSSADAFRQLLKKHGVETWMAPYDIPAGSEYAEVLYEALTGYGYEVAKPDGAFYLFVKAPGGSSMAFMEKAKEKGLLIVPGDDFGCPEYFRMCYCVSYDMIRRSLPVFRELIQG